MRISKAGYQLWLHILVLLNREISVAGFIF